MKKNYNKAYTVLMAGGFLLYIGCITVLNILSGDKDFSESENRKLNTKPDFSVASFISGDYTKDYERYISDQFIGRSFFVRLKSDLDTLEGKKEEQGVFIGKGNQLLQDFKKRPEEETKEKIHAINKFAESYDEINTTFMLVPTATKVLEDKLPRFAPVDDEEKYIQDIAAGLNENITFVNPYPALKSKSEEYLYYRTDHHWTTRGAYIGYLELCKALEIEPKSEEDFVIEQVTDEFYGSLSSKIGSMKGEADYIQVYFPKENGEVLVNYLSEKRKSTSLYNSESLDKKDKYEVFTGGNHPHINIKTLGDTSKKLLIIKDSYANSMLPFLTSHYGEIDVIDLRYYTDDLRALIDSKDITDILFLYNVNTFNEDNSILNLEM